MISSIFVINFLFGATLCSFVFEFDYNNNITSLSVTAYPSTLTALDDHVWTYKATKNNQIIIRVHEILLFPGDELIIYDEFPSARIFLAKFTNFDSSLSKLVSSSDTVSIVLTHFFNISNPTLIKDGHIFTFNITLEVAGYCSLNNSDRVSCESSSIARCFSASQDRCDDFWDCPINGYDEMGCSCPFSNEFACANFAVSGLCYDLPEKCNGIDHCHDKSDEMNCLESQCSLNSSLFLCLPLNASTSYNQHQTGECIPLSRICDEHVDCLNGADEAPELCSDYPLHSFSNTTSALIPSSFNSNRTLIDHRKALIARHFAALVTNVAVDNAMAAAAFRVDSRLRTLLTYVLSALLGPLLIVLTVGLMCRSSASSARTGRRSAEEARRARQQARYNSPIQRLIRDELRRRPPPPTYEEALNNSLFEEPILEGATVSPVVPSQVSHGVLSQDRIAAVREMSMKPAPQRVDVAVSCDLLRHGSTIPLSATSFVAASPTVGAAETGDSLPSRCHHREASTIAEDQIDSGVTSNSISGGDQPNTQTNTPSLFHRWFLSALGGLRRNGSGIPTGQSGTGSSTNGNNSYLHHESSFDQPEVSEVTIISSMHEEEEEDDNDSEDEDERDRNGDDNYDSVSSRRNSVDSQSDDHESDRETERRNVVRDGASSNPIQSTSLRQEGNLTQDSRSVLPRTVSNNDAGRDDAENFPGQRTPLLHQGTSTDSLQHHSSGNY